MPRFLIGIAVLSVALLSASDLKPSYEETIRGWQKHRVEGLRSPTGWLTLVGLFWLKPGENTIGAASSNDFILSKQASPASAGKFRLDGSKVVFTDANGIATPLVADEEKPDAPKIGTVALFLIKRGERYAIRAKDSRSPVLADFKGTQFFPIKPALNIEAKFIPEAKKIPILNVLGTTDLEESPGLVEFTVQGKQYHLRPIYEDTAHGRTLFFLFKDATNRTQTYQAGRMLNVPLPQDGVVHLDFNRSYNPPCTFTPYATCPLPPAENHLPIAIDAGELRYGKGHAEYAHQTE
jgi:uncharacterized protein